MLNNTNVFGVSMEEIEYQIERNAKRSMRNAILENSFDYEVSEEEI